MSAPSLTNMARVFGRIGVLSFGGPAAQIALMHRELVETRDWMSEQSYLRALSLCMMLPGPEAMQLATYAGWRLRGVPGGLLAGLLFVLPGAAVIFALAFAYVAFGALPLVQAGFVGIKAAVIVIVLQALLRLWPKALIHPVATTLAVMAFAALFVFALPFPLVIAVAAGIGALFLPVATSTDETAPPERHVNVLKTAALWGALWAAPLLGLWVCGSEFLLPLGVFFSKLAVVTFGGAYAVLAYMTQTVVSDMGWLSTEQMIDALGLAETTPGPLILVTQFVAVLAGIGTAGWGLGIAAGLLALWVTFVPCFLWIFAAAPYVEAIAQRPRLSAALHGITAAVVGVIANLSLWFALHVLFRDLGTWGAMPVPRLASFDLQAALLTAVAAVLLIAMKWPVLRSLTCCAALGVLLVWTSGGI